MANSAKVLSSIKDFLIKMKALDEAIPEELAQDALEMTEGVKEGLSEDEDPDVLEVTNDEDPEETEDEEACVEKKVEDAMVHVLRKYGLIKDESMKSLEDIDDEDPKETEDADGEEEVTVDPEKMNDSARRELLRKVKPMVASIKDSRQRKKFADAFAEALKLGNSNSSQYGDIMRMAKANARDSMSNFSVNKASDADYDFGMEIAKKFNPHYNKEG